MQFAQQVQLTLLTAIVKLFLKKPSETQELVQQVLSLATQLGGDLGGGVGGSPAVGQNFIPSSVPNTFAPSPTPAPISSGLNDLFELSTSMAINTGGYVAPKALSLKCRAPEVSQYVYQMYDAVLKN
ncbi:AP-2 complex subunit beta [Bagarius yarrelli]|uniref:AP-2 complex subunit beta n=1 Tax=Bagarius yarrelli TaxID=175774 RepID=A0A556UY04_BAGYA|nr:AP-2 complex subunit beta [Bagarius yarrelli]